MIAASGPERRYRRLVNDEVVVGAVNDIEELGSNLSRKTWQKITMIEGAAQPATHAVAPKPSTPLPLAQPPAAAGS
jgi:hypothetical protein